MDNYGDTRFSSNITMGKGGDDMVIKKDYKVDREKLADAYENEENLGELVKEIFENSFRTTDDYPLPYIVTDVRWSNRMTKALGQVRVWRNKQKIDVAFSKPLLKNIKKFKKGSENYNKILDSFEDVIKHELVHYYQVISGRKLSHDKEFGETLRKIGGSGDTYYTEEEKTLFKI